jgi:hypothetical protein
VWCGRRAGFGWGACLFRIGVVGGFGDVDVGSFGLGVAAVRRLAMGL